ncbi:hypothetical protein Gpo141_00002343 [Globisporangium polare]
MASARAPAHGVTAPPPPPPQQQQTDANEEGDVKLFRLNALQTLGDWSVHDDGDGRLFYYDAASKQSQWEPPTAFTGLEGELMMKLMLQHAVARSGFWSAHDAGNGTLYYFNERTRASVWERPEDWGLLPPPPPPAPQEDEDKGASATGDMAVDGDEEVAAKRPKKAKKAKRAKKSSRNHEDEDADANAEEANGEPVEQEEPPLSAEEIAAEQQRDAAERKRIESFRQMLRDKKVMPFTKWSVAIPRIISDPRFLAIPTMDGRRAIFEHFVTNRRDDLKAEKKAKLKEAKKAFSALLREQVALQLSDGVWEAKTNLSVFLSTLEDAMDAQRYKIIQENAMALLPTSIQEKLFEAVVSEFKEQAEKVKAEESELLRHLQQQLTTSGGDATASLRGAGWESAQLQQVVTAFYASKATKTLLSKEQQRKVYRRANEALAPKSDSKYGGGGSSGEYRSTRDAQDERPSRVVLSRSPPPSQIFVALAIDPEIESAFNA